MSLYCINCGYKIKKDENFCSNCGIFIPNTKRGKNKSNTKIIPVFISLLIILILAIAIIAFKIIYPWAKYQKAERLLSQYKYQEAVDIFADLGDYKDARQRVKKFIFQVKEKKSNQGICTYDYEFDIQGNITKIVSVDEKGKTKIENSTFNEQHLVISKTIYEEQDDGNIVETKETYQYDTDNNLTECIISSDNQKNPVQTVFKYEYDKNGNRIKEELIHHNIYNGIEDIETMSTFDYQYNDKNQVISVLFWGTCESYYKKLKYDQTGNIIEVLLYSDTEGKELEYDTNYIYEKNLLKQTIVKNASQTYVSSDKYEYDTNNNLTKCTSNYTDHENPANTITTITTYQLDKYGNPTETVTESESHGKTYTESIYTTYVVTGYNSQKPESMSASIEPNIE